MMAAALIQKLCIDCHEQINSAASGRAFLKKIVPTVHRIQNAVFKNSILVADVIELSALGEKR